MGTVSYTHLDVYKRQGEGRGIGLSNVKQILSKYPKVTLETKSIDHEFTHELKMYEG